ncbi:hypothetical protein NQ176_g3301 [Zarea fungicola]|uniref:Uncharacterized protein n=1 Tax=Zarea fungicola TaxID=93591 RepID=A0ACC1NJA0_9HYPO|nr:hypothetical protein NQ176_g3301 [Lecanicillium fungicola]
MSNEFKQTDNPTRKVPPPEASPAEVRAYLVDILINAHDATPDFAREAADRWKLGRGWDLRDLDLGRHMANETAAAERAAWEEWWASSNPRAHYSSIIPAAAVTYFYHRVLTAIFVFVILPQVWLGLQMPQRAAATMLMLFLAIGPFGIAAIILGR